LLGIAGIVTALGIGVASPAQAISFGAINCTIKVNYPHGSTHVNGTINVQSTVTCSAMMNEIYQKTFLYRSDGVYWAQGSFDRLNISSGASNASVLCTTGGPATYHGRAYTSLKPPAGYTPTSGSVESAGASNWVDCTSGATLALTDANIAQLKSEGFTVTKDGDGDVIASKDVVFTKTEQ